VGSVKLSWSTGSGIDGYHLCRDDALLATLGPARTAYTVKAAAGTAHKYAVRAFGTGGQSAATFVFAAAKYPAGTLTGSAAAGKITIRGANLRPGSVVTARLKTATLGTGRVGAGGTVTVSAKRKAGTVTVTGVDRNGEAVKVSKSVTAR
jgi:hypothetical protein